MLIEDYKPQEVEWCKVCRKHRSGECDGCHAKRLPGERFYRSVSTHYHPGSVHGVPAQIGIQEELCVDCYRKDYAETYPGHPLPELPPRGVDPKWHALQQKEQARLAAEEILTEGHALTGADIARLRPLLETGLRFSQ